MVYVCIIIIDNYIKCLFYKEVYISEICLIFYRFEKNIFFLIIILYFFKKRICILKVFDIWGYV